MAPKQTSGIDSFELANELVRRGRNMWMITLAALSTTILAMFMLVLQAAKPIPVVMWTDSPDQQARLVTVKPGEAIVREIDCKPSPFALATT